MHTERKAQANDNIIEMLKKGGQESEQEEKTNDEGKKGRSHMQAIQKVQSSNSSNKDTDCCVFKCGGEYPETEACEWVGCDRCYDGTTSRVQNFKGLPIYLTD